MSRVAVLCFPPRPPHSSRATADLPRLVRGGMDVVLVAADDALTSALCVSERLAEECWTVGVVHIPGGRLRGTGPLVSAALAARRLVVLESGSGEFHTAVLSLMDREGLAASVHRVDVSPALSADDAASTLEATVRAVFGAPPARRSRTRVSLPAPRDEVCEWPQAGSCSGA